MKQTSGKALARLVQSRGWQLSRVKGSHYVFVMAERRERLVIPIHGNKPLRIGTLRTLMKIAGLEESDL